MNNQRHKELLFEFVGNEIYLNEIEEYKSSRFVIKYGKDTSTKEERAHLICDLMAAEYIATIENTIKKRQNEILEILKKEFRSKLKNYAQKYSIMFHDNGLIIPITYNMDLYLGNYIETIDNIDDVNEMLNHFEYTNFSLQCHNITNDDELVEELRKIERKMFANDKGIFFENKKITTEPKLDESMIDEGYLDCIMSDSHIQNNNNCIVDFPFN